MKPAILIPALGALIVAGSIAGASPMGGMGRDHGPRMDFDAMDTDNDGKLTRAEIQARGQERFKAADSDGDGALSAEEMVAAAQARAAERATAMHERMLQWRDSDGDGKLSFDEMGSNRMVRMMERADTDNDGAVSQDEMAQMRDKMGKRGGRDGHHGKRGHGHGEGRGMGRD